MLRFRESFGPKGCSTDPDRSTGPSNIRCGNQDALSQRLPTAYLPPTAKIKALTSRGPSRRTPTESRGRGTNKWEVVR